MGMYTDPNRKRATDPGKVEGNPVFIYLDAFGQDQGKITELKILYRQGKVGDVEVKHYLVQVLNQFLEPIRQRRAEYEAQPELVKQILREGTEKEQKVVSETMQEVRRAMKLYQV